MENRIDKTIQYIKRMIPFFLENKYHKLAENNSLLRFILDHSAKIITDDELLQHGLTNPIIYTTNDPIEDWGPGKYTMYDKDNLRYCFKITGKEKNKLYDIIDLTAEKGYRPQTRL